MYSIFLARFVAESPDFLGFPPNFSTSKKVSAMQSCLRKAGVRPILVVTHAGDIAPRPAVVRKIGDFICIIPAVNPLLRNRLLKYLYGLFYSSVIVYKVRKRRLVSLFFCWDYLPDTFLPLLLQGARVLSRTVVDIEESIVADPRAGTLFKVFERLVVKHLQLRAIGNNISTAQTLGVQLEGVFPGFFANTLAEERRLLYRVEQKTFGDETVVLFSGRIDTVRGSAQFVELACRFQCVTDIRFIMTGYGNQVELAEIKRLAPSNLSFLPDLPRSEYLNLLFSADIAFNYLSDAKFAANSFPSKVIEYLLGASIVLSNHHIEINSDRVIVRENLDGMEALIVDYHNERPRWRASYSPEFVAKELSDFSISSCAAVFGRIFNA